MKRALLTMALLWSCMAFASAQSLPSITSATYGTAAPIGDSPNTAVTVRVSVPTVGGVSKVHVTVTDGGNNVLHAQEYPAALVALRARPDGDLFSLKFYTPADLAGATVKVELEDANGSKGAAFTATAH